MSRNLKFISVVGARPNFMKVAPLHRVFRNIEGVRHLVVHTGQHYDENMSKVFFDDLELPKPDIYLGVGSGSHAEQTARIMIEFEKVLLKERPDLVIVVGDVNSTIACSLTAAKLQVPVAHVEAGLRSLDRTMPEELNRIVTDALSDFLFVTEEVGVENLIHEGLAEEKVFLVGDVMVDSLVTYCEKAKASRVKSALGVTPKAYTLVTLHRPSNVDDRLNLGKILEILERIEKYGTIIFPIHPRTRKRIEEFGLMDDFQTVKGLLLAEPLGYLDFMNLMMDARLVMTDSGGIQEETFFFNVPCLTLRDTTERPATVADGTNVLAGLDVERVAGLTAECYGGKWKSSRVPDILDGRAAERIAEVLLNSFGKKEAVMSGGNIKESDK